MASPSTQEWLDKAAEDEQTVLVLKNAGGPWSVAAYHIQQAAEKFIKAALVESGVAPPKTHDLPQLLTLFTASAVPQNVDTAAAMVSPYAWLTRYPGAPSITAADVVQVSSELITIKSWAMAVINPPSAP